MKQMTLIEMDGFLKGKCIPCDLKVNETNAEYLVRKFAEAEAKISALSEDQQKAIESIKQADSAVKLAHEKFSALAAENELARKAVQALCDVVGDNTEVIAEVVGRDGVLVILEAMKATGNMPATDAFWLKFVRRLATRGLTIPQAVLLLLSTTDLSISLYVKFSTLRA